MPRDGTKIPLSMETLAETSLCISVKMTEQNSTEETPSVNTALAVGVCGGWDNHTTYSTF